MPSSGCNLFSCRLPTIWPDKNSSLTKKTRQKNASKFLNFRHFERSKKCCAAQMCNWSKPISKLHIWTLKCTNFISFLLIFIFFIFFLSILLFFDKKLLFVPLCKFEFWTFVIATEKNLLTFWVLLAHSKSLASSPPRRAKKLQTFSLHPGKEVFAQRSRFCSPPF